MSTNRLLSIAAAIAIALAGSPAHATTYWLVSWDTGDDANTRHTGHGSWNNAFESLQRALSNTQLAAFDHISVTASSAHYIAGPVGNPGHTDTFTISSRVRVEGGYAGTDSDPNPSASGSESGAG